MLSKLWNFLKGFKDWLDLIIKIVAVIGILTGFAGIKSCNKQKKEKADMFGMLTSKVETFKTKAGLNATKAENWIIKAKSLENINGEISHENTQIKNDLLKAKSTIKDLDIRLKDAKNYIASDLKAEDSIQTEIVFINCDQVEIKPIKKKHISINFIQNKNVLDLTYVYRAELTTVISRYPELKNNGKEHFLNWGFLWGWDYKTTSVIDDPNAHITNLVEITFDK